MLSQSESVSFSFFKTYPDDTIKVITVINELAYDVHNSYPDSTLKLGHEGEMLSKSVGYPLGIGNAKMVQAMVQNAKANFYESLQLYISAKEIFEELELKPQLAACLVNIGSLYNSFGDYDRAIELYEEAAAMQKETKDSFNYVMSLNNIGYTYRLSGSYERAIPPLYKSLKGVTELGNLRAKGFPMYNLGSVYMHLNIPDSAFKYLGQAHELGSKFKNQYLLSLTLADLGRMHLKINQLKQSETYLLKGYEIARNIGLIREQKDVAKYLADLYKAKSQTNESYKFFKIYTNLKDSLFNREQTKKLAFLEAESSFKQKEVQKEMAQMELNMLQEKELQNARLIQLSLIVGMLVSSLIAYLFYVNYNRKLRLNNSLKELNQQIEQQAIQLKEANQEILLINDNLEDTVNKRTAELKKRNDQLKEYLSNNSHLVRAPIARILGLLALYKDQPKEHLNLIHEGLHESAEELDEVIRDINDKLSSEEI